MRTGIRPRLPLQELLLASWLGGCAWACGEEAAFTATRLALDADQPVEASTCLRDAPEGAEKRLLAARITLALGGAQEALRSLGMERAEQAMAVLTQWPPDLQGEVIASAAEAALALAQPQPALSLLQNALALGGPTLEVDRCLALYLDALLQQGQEAEAVSVAQRLWHGWPRSRYRAHGGLVLAHALGRSQPTAAREILAAIRIDATVTSAVHLHAVEELCAILYAIHPGQCLVVAEQELAICLSQHADSGTLPRYRALALAAIDPVAGAVALHALPPSLALDPVVVAALAVADHARGITVAMRCERALSDAALGRIEAARKELEPLAAQEDLAVVTLVSLPGTDPMRFLGTPGAATPRAAIALCAALVASGHADLGWRALQVALPPASATGGPPPALGVLYWASRCDPDPRQRAQWRARLLASAAGAPGLEAGLAWCDEAQARLSAGLDATTAWVHAAQTLPSDHPYFPEACWRAAMALSAAGHDDQAVALLRTDAAWGGEDAPHARCRFLLAQLEGRRGDRIGALQAARSLLGRGNADQQQRLETLIHQLDVKMP